MKAILDTNVLVRIVVQDDKRQAGLARRLLTRVKLAAVPTTALCELVWVLRKVYGVASDDIASALRQLLETDVISVQEDAVAAGLAMLDAGGDFADGVIAFDGAALGGDTFYSFDKAAVAKLSKRGVSAALVSAR